ncbi:MAG: KAP family P-loop NTPase fold protein [Myxococcota bacterium]
MQQSPPVHTDRPVTAPEDDLLGRAGFAKQLARTLITAPKDDALVVGLYGPWGAGKTSVLNLVEHELGGAAKAGAGKVAIVRFNPWYFKGDDTLVSKFFDSLAAGIGASAEGKQTQLVSALRKYGGYLKPVSTIAGIAAGIAVPGGHLLVEAAAKILGDAGKTVADAAEAGADALDREESLEDVRARVIQLLKESGTRVVVFVDDIDRLYADDVRTVFKLVRLVGDLPNVSYLLAFDPEIVAGCIAQAGPKPGDIASGQAFIEKIVQVAIHLPRVRADSLREFILLGLIQTISEVVPKFSNDDVGRLVNIWDRSLGSRIRTVREGKRILNAARFAVHQLAGEVDPVELVLLEALRIFAPAVYDEIRATPSLVLNGPEAGFRDRNAKSPLGRVLEAMGQADPADLHAVSELIVAIFPRLGKYQYDTGWNSRWRRQQRLASEEHLDKALHYGVPSGVISDVAYGRVLDGLRDGTMTASQLSASLAEVAKVAGWKDIVWRLRTEVDQLSPVQAEQLARALLLTAAEFNANDGIIGVLPTQENAALLIGNALKRTSDPAGLIVELLRSAPSLTLAAYLVRWTRCKEDDPERPANWAAVEGAALATFADVADAQLVSPDWFEHPFTQATSILYLWRKARGPEFVADRVRGWLASQAWAPARLLRCCYSDGWELETGARTRGEFDGSAYDSLAAVVDPEVIATAIGELATQEIAKEVYYAARDRERDEQAVIQFAYIFQLRKKAATENVGDGSDTSGDGGQEPDPEEEEGDL